MAKRSKHEDDGDLLIGRPHSEKRPDGRARVRAEEPGDGGPREPGDQRVGNAHDGADPSEVARGEAELEDDEAVSEELDTGEIASSGERAGLGRGEHPREGARREG